MTEASDGRSRRAAQRREQRRREILQAAGAIIRQKGYQATSINDVIDAAGISRGTFYLYFESRDALFLELIDSFIAMLIEQVVPVRIEAGSPAELLYENIRRIVAVLFEHRDLTTLLLREAIGLDEAVDAKLDQLDSFMHRMVVGAIENGHTWGLVREIEHKDIVAIAIIGMLKEVLYQSLIVQRFPVEDPDTIARAIFDFGARGLLKS